MRALTLRVLAVVLVAWGGARAVRADILVLANGDRLTGELVKEEEGNVVFRSALLGDVRVPAEHTRIISTSNEAIVTSAPMVRARPAFSPAPVRLAKTEIPTVEGPARDDSRDDNWKRQVELGMSTQAGLKDQSNLSLRLEAGHKMEEGSLDLVVSHHYGKSDGAIVSDATSANATLTHNLNEDLFVRGSTRYDRDVLEGVDHDAEQSLGLGYTVLGGSNLNLSVGGGAALRNRSAQGEEATWDGLFDAFGRFKCDFSRRLSLSQDFSLTAAPNDSKDYRIKTQTALVNQLTEVLRMTVRYEFEYHGSALADTPAQQRLVTAIGCVF